MDLFQIKKLEHARQTLGLPKIQEAFFKRKKKIRNLVPDFWTCPTAKKGHIYKGGGFLVSDGSSQGGYNYEI